MTSLLGWTATVLFTICYIPQIIKTLKSKTTAGLSPWLLLISLVANIVALVYAVMIHQTPLITKYILGIVFVSFCLAVYWKVSRTS
jgi:uncharacterized protein with PQ loop repeat